ncbi:MAG: 5,6-dimethylbenzimidazole synthase [Candidatus Lindowbacteria bacterium RIFCSPLOWO2_12_FULL_62_27]|nr:MAG: 5,6-dimethylbenzimidazole synthase [Candidatus Lindowbacteria bacterium RIFCSPLOWO2_12_FULL_62_27]OGH63350.1 MAG: 5,6-dimethylbenzimidazole synthase [Candidatus Lindowbacteria bacterium RIFCSPLOWO2_02_FULL_62_12]
MTTQREDRIGGAEGKLHEFPDEWKEGVYRAIYARRDIRSQFKPDPIAEDVLARILRAAHHAPSVGFMQPWDFILIRDVAIKQKIREDFERATEEAAVKFAPEKEAVYRKLKLEGIREAPINICVTCDRRRFGPVVIGRTSQPVMDLFSSVCAVQNLWLAARAEGLGVGWVSILHPRELRRILALPAEVEPIAYLCVGHVTEFPDRPELESAGWLPRMPLGDVIRLDGWDTPIQNKWEELEAEL